MFLELKIEEENMSAEMRLIFAGVRAKFPETVLPCGVIRTGDIVPTVAMNENLLARSFPMEWGYIDEKRKRDKHIPTVRIKTASEKVMFYDGFVHRRCVVAVDRFYVTGKDREGKTVKYTVRHAKDDILYLGAIYCKRDGKPYTSILTVDPPQEYETFTAQLPLVVPRNDCAKWIHPQSRIKNLWNKWNEPLIFESEDN